MKNPSVTLTLWRRDRFQSIFWPKAMKNHIYIEHNCQYYTSNSLEKKRLYYLCLLVSYRWNNPESSRMWRWNKIPLAHFGTPPVVDSAVYQTHETRYFYSILKSVQNGILVIKSYVSVHGEYLDTQPPPPPPPPLVKVQRERYTVGNHVIFCTFIWTEWARIYVSVSSKHN